MKRYMDTFSRVAEFFSRKISVTESPRAHIYYSFSKMNTLQKWVVLLFVLTIGVGFYYFVKKNSDVQSDEQIATTTEDVVTVPNNGWKTYTNDELGFSFEYPSSVAAPKEIKSPNEWRKSIRLNLNPDPLIVSISSMPGDESSLGPIYDELLLLNTDFDGYQVKVMSEPDPDCWGDGCSYRYLWEKTRVDGLPALDRISCGGGDACGRSVYVLSGVSVFHFNSYGNYFVQTCDGSSCVNAKPLRKVETTTDFDRVLSSFKFTK